MLAERRTISCAAPGGAPARRTPGPSAPQRASSASERGGSSIASSVGSRGNSGPLPSFLALPRGNAICQVPMLLPIPVDETVDTNLKPRSTQFQWHAASDRDGKRQRSVAAQRTVRSHKAAPLPPYCGSSRPSAMCQRSRTTSCCGVRPCARIYARAAQLAAISSCTPLACWHSWRRMKACINGPSSRKREP